MIKKYLTFSHFTLLVALCISAIAAWYSVIGLTAIFAGAVIPIIIMGGILEIAKITTTVWLHRYWNQAGITIRTYLTTAVVALACLTSMGIFGLLSKAHSDQNLVSGDVFAKISLIDEKIKIQRDNIDAARKALSQMDSQVDQRLSRSDSEQGAERAVQIRRQQARERTVLQNEISVAQREISKLNEERAPIAGQLRKVEAEVGPIKYIAALIYGDNPDSNLLERAVRWVTILIVVVFDPLAIVLILAANNSLNWDRRKKSVVEESSVTPSIPIEGSWEERIDKVENSTPWPNEWDTSTDDIDDIDDVNNEADKDPIASKQDDLLTKKHFSQSNYKDGQLTFNPMRWVKKNKETEISNKKEVESQEEMKNSQDTRPIETDSVTVEKVLFKPTDEYVHYDGKITSLNALKELRPDLIANEENIKPINFSPSFPKEAVLGEICIRVDVMPHKVYKFNGIRWIMLDKNETTVYLQSELYVKYLIKKLESGEYDINELTQFEQDEISRVLATK